MSDRPSDGPGEPISAKDGDPLAEPLSADYLSASTDEPTEPAPALASRQEPTESAPGPGSTHEPTGPGGTGGASEAYHGGSDDLEARREGPDSADPGSGARESDLGFYAAIEQAEAKRLERDKRLRERRLNVTESTLLKEIEGWEEEELPPPKRIHQVGVRLSAQQWNRLLLCARWSGITPTTMARVLINRGARAIIDDELRHRRLYGADSD